MRINGRRSKKSEIVSADDRIDVAATNRRAVLCGPIHLPSILPHSPMLYAVLRKTHTVVAYLFFTTFIAHFSEVLFHTVILRDHLIDRMVPWKVR